MRLAFDTNVYDFICKSGQTADVRLWLDAQSHHVVLSESVLLELWRITDYAKRKAQIETAVGVSKSFATHPGTYLQAMEILNEVRRRRPTWIRRPGRDERRKIRELLRGHREEWTSARDFPGFRPSNFDDYKELANTADRQAQRRERQQILDLGGITSELRATISGFPDVTGAAAEIFWRSKTLLTWHEALFRRKPILRDYYDWLGPLLQLDQINADEFAGFWLRELDPERVPRTWLIGLAEYFQLGQKVTGGNALDLNHVLQVLGCDAFLTSDVRFFKVLTNVREQTGIGAWPCLVDQQTPTLDALAAAISSTSALPT